MVNLCVFCSILNKCLWTIIAWLFHDMPLSLWCFVMVFAQKFRWDRIALHIDIQMGRNQKYCILCDYYYYGSFTIVYKFKCCRCCFGLKLSACFQLPNRCSMNIFSYNDWASFAFFYYHSLCKNVFSITFFHTFFLNFSSLLHFHSLWYFFIVWLFLYERIFTNLWIVFYVEFSPRFFILQSA